MNELNCKRPIEALHISQYPIDDLDSLPDAILGERDVIDEATGNTKYSLVRVPARKLFPQGNMDNVIALDPNNEGLEIPENQVRAGYMQNSGGTLIMQYADASHPAQFLMLGEMADMMLVQNTGFISIPKGHDYILGQTYYAGDNGEPTTDNASGQKLFVPVSRTKLAVLL